MTSEEMIKTGNRIKNLRKEHQLSQEEVAMRLDISRQAVTRWENGRTLPSSCHMLKLAELFGVSVESLAGVGGKGGLAVSGEKTETIDKMVSTLEELKANIKTEIKHRIWMLWVFFLTILFFVVCWFFDIYLGWDVYVWHYMDLYCYPWTACFLIFVGGIFQKKRFVAAICSGCVLTVLVGQLITLCNRSYSLLRFNESWIALIFFWNLALIMGLLLEYRAKKKPWKMRTKVWMSCVVLLFVWISFSGFYGKYAYNQGAEDGYLAGYKTGLYDAELGEVTKAEQYADACFEYKEKYSIGNSRIGTLRYKGFFMYWESGYNEGYKKGEKEEALQKWP